MYLSLLLSFCWSGRVFSSLWSNASMVKSNKDHSFEVFSKYICHCLCLCCCLFIGQVMFPNHSDQMFNWIEVWRAMHTNVAEIHNLSTVNCLWMKSLMRLNFKMAKFANLQWVSSLLNLSRAEILIFGLIFDQMDLQTKHSDKSDNVWHWKLKSLRYLSKLG